MQKQYKELEKQANEFFENEYSIEDGEDVCAFLDHINSGIDGLVVVFDSVANVAEGIGGDVMVSYWSNAIKKRIVLESEMQTDGFESVHDLVEEIEGYNREAQALEKRYGLLTAK